MVVDGTSGRLFIDGSLADTKNWTGVPGSATTSTDFRIGKYASSTQEIFFKGSIDDVRIYDRALSQDEIIQLYHDTGGTGEQSILLKVDPSGEVGGLWTTSSTTDFLLVDVNDNVWTSGLHSGSRRAWMHTLYPGSARNLLRGCSPRAASFGRIGRGGAEAHNVQLGAAEVINGARFWQCPAPGGIPHCDVCGRAG